ncbi:MAG: PQQ-binding-like beta-propeller repeat protein [Acidobacteriota bacterium]
MPALPPSRFGPWISLIVLTGLLATAPLAAENWPQWRGPNHDGVSPEQNLPERWSKTENVQWRLPMPGPAGSTPVVWDGRTFVTSTVDGGDGLAVLAVDRDGTVAWRQDAGSGSQKVPEQFALETTLASPSPVTDGEHLWTFFGSTRLSCFKVADGKQVWQRDLADSFGAPVTYFGLSSSPLLHDGRLYIQMLHGEGQKIIALDAETGRDLWAHDRATDARAECLHAYTSPTLVGAGADTRLLIHGADYTTAHALGDGKEIWRHGGLNPEDGYNPSFRLVATPVEVDGLLVVPSAKRGPVYGLKVAGARGTLTGSRPHTTWKLDRGTPDVPSPVIHDGLVYLSDENGRLTVIDAASGETVYAERVHQSTHRGSPVLADGKLYLSGTDGTVSVVRAGRSFEVVAKNALDERLAASPAVSGGALYLRTYDALYAIRGAEPPKAETAGGSP